MPQNVEQQKIEVVLGRSLSSGEHHPADRDLRGKMSRPVTREVLRSGRSIAILLYDPKADGLLFTEQFRVGALLNQLHSSRLVECPAGMVADDEDAESAARRETEEETGCDLLGLDKMGEYLTSPGVTDELEPSSSAGWRVTKLVGSWQALGSGRHSDAALHQ